MSMISSLVERWFRRTPPREHLTITLYSRAQCGCCRKASEILSAYQRRYRFRIEEIDIDTDPELAAQYDTEVPVVVVDGKVRFRGQVNPVLLERLLIAAGRQGAGSAEAPEHG